MIIKLYDWLHKHNLARWGLLSVLTVIFIFSASRLSFQEDILDFLPLGTSDRDNLSIYQDISGANQIIAIFENPHDEDLTVSAIETFCDYISHHDTLGISSGIIAKLDIEEINRITDFVYSNIPYFLTDEDYAHIDSLLSQPNYIASQLKEDRELLMFPSGGLLSQNISRDPLNIFTPVVNRLSKSQSQSKFETYEGYIFSPDMKKAIVMISSPYGNSETEKNSELIALLEDAIKSLQHDYPQVKAHLTGGPRIAVDNAQQIRNDSILAISISVVLIVLLLCYSFRSIRNISLIAISIAWGWIFALCGISIIHSSVSVIVIGISSIIIGIAVNYPLHLIDHTRHEPNMRRSLSEIIVPLVVGNITTIGAFLALVPLKSVALRDLGLFASLLLLGTILFVLVFLPHMIKVGHQKKSPPTLLRMMTEIQIENKRWIIFVVILLTAVFSWYSLGTKFDSDISNVNYMTRQQRDDMAYFQSLMHHDNDSISALYIVSSASDIDDALTDNIKKQSLLDSLASCGIVVTRESAAPFITSLSEQHRRLKKWHEMLKRYNTILHEGLQDNAEKVGFDKEAFSDFYTILDGQYKPKRYEDFSVLTNTVFSNNFSIDTSRSRYSVVDKVYVPSDKLEATKELFSGSFDVKSMNGAIASSLSNDFNYIGWMCGIIVFLFLWLSFGNIELALLSFIPMAVSWIWILGIMNIFGIHFNIVNIILATFIFGQGDDYTIFMTQGCQYEYAYRKPILSSYKSSIILSALIMFIGIGSLIVAKHPAMHSLAEVTIIGMFSVVLMAYLFPPYIFRWLVYNDSKERIRPITLRNIFRRNDINSFVSDCYRYRGIEISSNVNKRLRQYIRKGWVEKINHSLSPSVNTVVFINSGWGEIPLMFAIQNPDIHIIAVEGDETKRCITKNVVDGRTKNMFVMDDSKSSTLLHSISKKKEYLVVILDASDEDMKKYESIKTIIIS